MRWLVIMLSMVSFTGCGRSSDSPPAATYTVRYEAIGSSEFADVSGVYRLPLLDSLVVFSDASLPWSVECVGRAGDSAWVKMTGHSPSSSSATLSLYIYRDGFHLAMDRCTTWVTHSDADVCNVEVGSRL